MPKYATVAFDSASELARLTFSFDMKKHAGDMEKIRAVQNYPGASERINMLVRRLKDLRDRGVEIVITAHEQLEKIYAKGGMIAAKGQQPSEPIAVKGWPDLPGSRTPDEVARACDNVFRMRWVNEAPIWIARREAVGGGGDYWEVKDRFNALVIKNGFLPANYAELAQLAKQTPGCTWSPPYITLIYGAFGIGKTRSLLSWPRPLYIFDLDRGTGSISGEIAASNGDIKVDTYNSEETEDYPRFLLAVEELIR